MNQSSKNGNQKAVLAASIKIYPRSWFHVILFDIWVIHAFMSVTSYFAFPQKITIATISTKTTISEFFFSLSKGLMFWLRKTQITTALLNYRFFAWSAAKLQSRTKYLRQALIFIWNNTLREKFILYFKKFFASIDKNFIFSGRLGTRL